ncbi:LOW QUALITY PROTEIN: uncharacterized protein LOC117134905 [Drosophila busckii]|uniref:LOW QUALITY PROTEIN: uncharacterized protein LOC117134905 n=1 Tax=Drosophila busckii TaxID=30019 RepID=UPI0014332273|nr:LOW QUALITY PROTEIN: uncharacterized protein LOC117134905 [Drosophila busckii]
MTHSLSCKLTTKQTITCQRFKFFIVKIYIIKQDIVMRPAIPPNERLVLTLRFLATGDSYHSLMYLFRIPVSTAVSLSVAELCMNACIGAFDGKHVVMEAPNSGSSYFNYKDTHSVVLMVLAHENYKIIYFDVEGKGRISDDSFFITCTTK